MIRFTARGTLADQFECVKGKNDLAPSLRTAAARTGKKRYGAARDVLLLERYEKMHTRTATEAVKCLADCTCRGDQQLGGKYRSLDKCREAGATILLCLPFSTALAFFLMLWVERVEEEHMVLTNNLKVGCASKIAKKRMGGQASESG